MQRRPNLSAREGKVDEPSSKEAETPTRDSSVHAHAFSPEGKRSEPWTGKIDDDEDDVILGSDSKAADRGGHTNTRGAPGVPPLLPAPSHPTTSTTDQVARFRTHSSSSIGGDNPTKGELTGYVRSARGTGEGRRPSLRSGQVPPLAPVIPMDNYTGAIMTGSSARVVASKPPAGAGMVFTRTVSIGSTGGSSSRIRTESQLEERPVASSLLTAPVAVPVAAAPVVAAWSEPSTARRSPAASATTPASAAGTSSEADLWLENHKAYLRRPVSKASGMVRCFIDRNKGGLSMFGINVGTPQYQLFAEEDGRFLMAAQKRSRKPSANYLLVVDQKASGSDSAKKYGPRVVAKLRADMSGSSYMIYDAGRNPKKAVIADTVRQELGIIHFLYNAIGPGHMRITVPTVSSSGDARVYREAPASAVSGSGSSAPHAIGTSLREAEAEPYAVNAGVMQLGNKMPTYDPVSKKHQLFFGGRVKLASVKNFQVAMVGNETEACCAENEWKGATGSVVLQFGRATSDRFIMDVAWPLSILQAFAITLATLDPKMSENAGYERVRTLTGAATSGSASPGGPSTPQAAGTSLTAAPLPTTAVAPARRPSLSGFFSRNKYSTG